MLDELHHFVLIVEHGTFTAAAHRAHLSQPALTASIRRLEEHMGARLLHRGPGGSELTAAGRALLPRARAALAAVEDGRRAVAEVVGLQAGAVSLGAGATACTYLLPPILAEFRARYPGLRVRLREAFTERILGDLQDGEIDLGIITGEGDERWREDELIVVASPDFDVRRREFLTFPEGSPTRALLLRHFEGVEIVMELSSIAAIKGNVRAGMGKALLSRAAVETDLQLGRLVEVRCAEAARAPIVRCLSIVHRGVERLPPAAARLRELLLQAPLS